MGEPAATISHAEERWLDQIVSAYEWLFAPPGSRPPTWDPQIARERLLAAMKSDDAAVLVALRTGSVVGFCTAYLDLLSVRFGLRCWVEDLAVDPAARSRGVGAELLTAARRWAAEHGASHLELDSAASRTDAHRFYEREGANHHRSICFGWHGLDAER